MLNSNEERRAILYSAPQLVSTDIGCLTMSYLGKDVHLQLYITQGTVYTPKTMVFERRDIDSKLFATTSIQTPTNIPYMVLFICCGIIFVRGGGGGVSTLVGTCSQTFLNS